MKYLKKYEDNKIIVPIDTSGSMSKYELENFFNAIEMKILKEYIRVIGKIKFTGKEMLVSDDELKELRNINLVNKFSFAYHKNKKKEIEDFLDIYRNSKKYNL